MKLTPDDFSERIARQLAPIYVLGGEEVLIVEEALDAIRSAARRQGFIERQVLHAERGFDWSEFEQACSAMSLFGDRRLVELRISGGGPGNGAARIERIAAQPPPDTLLVVVCGELDRKARSSGWWTACEQTGASLYAWPIEGAEFGRWLRQRAAGAGLRLSDAAAQLLMERTEGNLLACAQEITKLRLLFGEQPIDTDALRAAVADSARYDVFDLCELVLAGQGASAVRACRHLLDEGSSPVELVATLAWTLRQWIAAQQALQRSGDPLQACLAARVPQPRQAAMQRALRRGRLVQLYGWLRGLTRIDQLAKTTGAIEQASQELLTWLVAASGHAAASPLHRTARQPGRTGA